MKPSPNLIKQLTNIDGLLERADPKVMFDTYFSSAENVLTARALTRCVTPEPAVTTLEEGLFARNIEDERLQILEAGYRGLQKIRADGENADLEPVEHFGAEAIILLEDRPAILIQRGEFLQVPPKWSILEGRKDGINKATQSVGRIEVMGHPSYDWVGTGFLVADDVVMTNRHVADIFCHRPPRTRTWRFKPGMSGRIDYMEEWGVLEKAEFEFSSVIGVHDVYDLALFRVWRTSPSGATPLQPLTIASELPSTLAGRIVYTCGYPAWDGYRNDPVEMMRIFANIFNVKRLQPGELCGFDGNRNIVEHNCSTLGGNSGSCVIDLEANLVVGLHFGGRYLETNKAVALWRLRDDPLLKKAGVNFD